MDDFNWNDHAYGILYNFNPEIAENIQNETEFAIGMTKGHFGYDLVDTSLFRNAIVMYLMLIFGLKDDVFKYYSVNKVLQFQHKTFIKKVICDP